MIFLSLRYFLIILTNNSSSGCLISIINIDDNLEIKSINLEDKNLGGSDEVIIKNDDLFACKILSKFKIFSSYFFTTRN